MNPGSQTADHYQSGDPSFSPNCSGICSDLHILDVLVSQWIHNVSFSADHTDITFTVFDVHLIMFYSN
jgi:hypothetical protein